MSNTSADLNQPRLGPHAQKDNASMTETSEQKPKRKWVGLVVTTLLGIAATVGVGYYQLLQSDKQAVLAEEERARAVRQSLVSIVEEHVLNDKPIDLPRLSRLIDQRRKEERVSTPIAVAELLEQAEFNILESRYLPFERKQSVKNVFDTLYTDLSTRTFAPYSSDESNADLLNTLASQIRDGKSSDALQTLKRLQEAHVKDLQQARVRARASFPDALTELLNNPLPLVMILVAYISLLFFVMRNPRFRSFLGLGRKRPAPDEALEMIERYLEVGMSDDWIVDRLVSKGVPDRWAVDRVRELHALQISRPTRNPEDAKI